MTMAILGSALFFVAVPSVVAGLIPWWITGWEFLPPFFDLQATRAVGILLIVAGVPGLVDSFALCCARARHAGADRSDAEPRGDGSLSLRAQSYLRCRRRRHSGPSDPVRRLAS